MWKPLSIVSGLILLSAGGIMYTQVRNPLLSERKQKAAAENNKKSAERNKLESKEARAKSDTDLADSKALLDKNTRAKNDAQAAKDQKNTELTTATTEKDAAAKELADLEQKLKDLGGLERLVAELKLLEAKKATLDTGIANTKDAIASTIAHKNATDKVIAGLKQLDLWQKTGTMDPKFRTRVAAVNPDLGFVVLAEGNASRVVKQAKFDVVRGESTVGRLVVTHIEQNRSICEVVPGSVAAGDSILPGDLVVVNSASTPRSLAAAAGTEKSEEKKDAAAPAEAAAPADPADPFAAPAADAPAPAAEAPAADSPAPAAEAPMEESSGN